jgi:2'-5' RNA ligase
VAVSLFDQVRNFFRAPKLDEALRELAPRQPEPALRTSWVFDSHVMTEGANGSRSTPKSASLAYAEKDQWGQENVMRSFMGLTPRERKETLLSIFLANPWASNCIDTIALYIISGGMTIEPRVPNPDKSQRKDIEKLLMRINEDWDFNQYVYDLLTDEMIFGETFAEYTMYGGVPYQLFSTDCVTMDTEHDRYGRVIRYKQQLKLGDEVNYLDKNAIIRWWNPHKRAKVDPFSPLERIQDAILLDKKMVNWSTTFFQKGARFPYWVEFLGDQDEAERYLAWFKQNYTGEKNAHLPPVAYNGAKFHEFGSGALDIDFEKGLDRTQTITLAAFHVPPSIACIAESGNRLTDMSDGQRKILQYIACDPRRHRFFEKFNYRLIRPYFGEDYYVSTRYADFRDDKSLAEVADIRVRNGTLTQNEVRQEMGKEAYQHGGDVPVIITNKEVTPVPRLEDLEEEQRTTAKQQLDQGDLNTEMLKTKVEQAKNPPVMTPGQQPNQPGSGKATKTANNASQKKQQQKGESYEHRDNRNNRNDTRETSDEHSVHTELDGRNTHSMQDGAPGRRLHSVESAPLTAGKADGNSPQSLSSWKEVEDAQTTQSPAHQQTDARLTSLSTSQDTQESNQEAGTVRTATTGTDIVAGNNHEREEGTIPSGSNGSDTGGETQGNTGTLEDAQHTGMMLAFMLDPEAAKQLAIPGGEPENDLHLTLAYLGDMEDAPHDGKLSPHTSPEQLITLLNELTQVQEPPLEGTTGGVARFINPDQDIDPVVSLVNIPGLQMWRNWLVQKVEQAGYFVAKDFDFTPHITLAYISKDAPMPIESFSPVPLSFDTICLVIGDKNYNFKLGKGQIPQDQPQQKQESADNQQSDRDKLAYVLAAIFLLLQTGKFSTDEQNRMVDLLAGAYLAAQMGAYQAAFQAIGSDATWEPDESDIQAAKGWATEQVGSIASTFEEMFKNAAPANDEEAKQFIDNLITWKPQQIANATIGVGADAGTRSAVADMLDALTQVEIDTSLIPDGLSADQIRLRVVPGESSSDFCSEYAGKDFSLDEAGDIPYFPAHPGCVHSIEVYTVGGEIDG